MLLFVVAGCIEPRALRGHIVIRAARPEALFEKQHLELRVEDRRLGFPAPFDGKTGEAFMTADGCVHVIAGTRTVAFCPLPEDRNIFTSAIGRSFAIELRQGNSILRIKMDGEYADIALAHDAVGDELRANPALLGVVVRLGALPRSMDGVYVSLTTPAQTGAEPAGLGQSPTP